jgi:hypothetical protein
VPQHAPLGEHWREIIEREHRVHAGQGERGGLRHAADRGVRVRAAHEARVQQARHLHVVDVAAAPAQERLVLDA